MIHPANVGVSNNEWDHQVDRRNTLRERLPPLLPTDGSYVPLKEVARSIGLHPTALGRALATMPKTFRMQMDYAPKAGGGCMRIFVARITTPVVVG